MVERRYVFNRQSVLTLHSNEQVVTGNTAASMSKHSVQGHRDDLANLKASLMLAAGSLADNAADCHRSSSFLNDDRL